MNGSNPLSIDNSTNKSQLFSIQGYDFPVKKSSLPNGLTVLDSSGKKSNTY
ncbi:hypothetical protein ACYSNW_00305 [Enterococcus sp. LJL99]